MIIDTLELNNFRNYTNASVNFFDGINFVVGQNAQGKTNMLEAIYIMSVGKSPKNSKDKQIIKFNESNAKIGTTFNTRAGKKSIIMYLDKTNKKSIKLNGLNILKLTELVGELSVVYFSPDELRLIKDAPEDRRTFLDISISQFDKAYLYTLLKYDRVLKMRNLILKSQDSNESKIEQLKLFTPQLIDAACEIITKRLEFVEKLKNYAKNIHTQITQSETLNLEYSYKIEKEKNIKDDLEYKYFSTLNKDIELGYTTIGPHRDDILFTINNLDTRYYASQGQQRTVALVLKLSLMEVIRDEISEYPILLLDDVLSELDDYRQNKLLDIIQKYQTIITCTKIPEVDIEYSVIKIKNGNVIKE